VPANAIGGTQVASPGLRGHAVSVRRSVWRSAAWRSWSRRFDWRSALRFRLFIRW